MGRTRGKRYSQAERLLRLYRRLHMNGAIRPSSDPTDLGVTRRTLERDMEVLREVLGGDLVTGEEDGRRVYSLNTKDAQGKATVDQLFTVEFGLRLTSFLGGGRFASTLDPAVVGRVAGLPAAARRQILALRNKVVVVTPGQKRYDQDPERLAHLDVLLDGLVRQSPVDISYQSHSSARRGAPPRRLRVHPLALVLYRGGVYFQVEVADGDADGLPSRVQLALDRVTSSTAAGGRFEMPENFDPLAMYTDAFGIMATGTPREVVIRVSPSMAPYVRERWWHRSESIDDEEDGSVVLTMRLAGDEVLDWVLSMGPDAELVSPPDLRVELRRRLVDTLALYADRSEGGSSADRT